MALELQWCLQGIPQSGWDLHVAFSELSGRKGPTILHTRLSRETGCDNQYETEAQVTNYYDILRLLVVALLLRLLELLPCYSQSSSPKQLRT